jgi:hypothetical protein
MRTFLTLTLVSMIGIAPQPWPSRSTFRRHRHRRWSQQAHTANGGNGWSRQAKHESTIRRHADDLCSLVNGWRAFPIRGRYGFFDTHRVPCCRC